MQINPRYIFFGFGALLGSLILGMTYIGKYQAVKQQSAQDTFNGYSLGSGIIAGQDLKARNPFDTGPALAIKDSDIGSDHMFTRILIAQGDKKGTLWRIEETLWKDPNSRREKLVRRRIMYADRVVVRVREGEDDSEHFKRAFGDFNMKIAGPGNGPRLYKIDLPRHEIDAVPNAISKLMQVPGIEAVVPDYVDINKK